MDPHAIAEYREASHRRRVLVVGAGAIGQVFAHHLISAGAEVSFLVKPRYAAAAEDGFTLHRYGVVGERRQRAVRAAHVVADLRQLRSLRIEQVWLCVSSVALREPGWLEALAAACPQAVWVSFQPGVDDPAFLAARLPRDRLVHGMVNFIAYQSPLPGENLSPEGVAYYLPPLSFIPFVGPLPHVTTVVDLLRAGGLNAGVRPDTLASTRFGGATLLPFVIALECSGWSFANLRKSEALLTVMTTVIAELHGVIAGETGLGAGMFRWLQRPAVWRAVLRLAPVLVPFPAEAYFRYHFLKVRAQTEQIVEELGQLCRDNALVPRALESLRDQWRGLRVALQAEHDVPAMPLPVASVITAPALPVIPGEPTTAPALPVLPAQPTTAPALPVLPGEPTTVTMSVLPAKPVTTAPAMSVLPVSSIPTIPAPIVEFEDLVDYPVDVTMPAPVKPHVRQPPVQLELLDLELEPVSPVEPTDPQLRPDAPVLRSVADLEASQEIESGDLFDLGDLDLDNSVVSSVPLSLSFDRLIPVPAEPQQRAEPTDVAVASVEFSNGETHPRRALSREDFVQTEFATEQQDASLRHLKDKLRARYGDPTRPMRLPEE